MLDLVITEGSEYEESDDEDHLERIGKIQAKIAMLQEQQKQIKKLKNRKKKDSSPKEYCLTTFLNDTCKDAQHFEIIRVDRRHEISEDDVYYLINSNYNSLEVCEHIMIKNLAKLPPNEKYFYCSDTHRNVWWVKTKDGWKRDNDLSLMTKFIFITQNQLITAICNWSKKQKNKIYGEGGTAFQYANMISSINNFDKKQITHLLKRINQTFCVKNIINELSGET